MLQKTFASWSRLVAALGLVLTGVGCDEGGVVSVQRSVCLQPEALDFGVQTLRTSATRNLTVSNCGSAPLDRLQFTLGPSGDAAAAPDVFTIGEAELPVFFSPGEFFQVPIRFRPTADDTYEAVITVALENSPGSGPTQSATIKGRGEAPGQCAAIAPEAIDFGTVEVGDAVSETLTVSNVGDVPCNLSGARVVGGDNQFTVVGLSTDKLSPAGSDGDTTEISVRYAPLTDGPHEGTFSVVVNGGNEATAQLTGSGLIVDRCSLSATPAPVIFPRAAIDLAATEASVTLKNIGSLPCTFEELTVTGAEDFTILSAPAPGAILNVGEEAEVELAFAATAVGSRQGTLVVPTVEEGDYEVPLSSTGDPRPSCALRFTPGPLTFDPVAVGLTSVASMEIKNLSPLSCDLTRAEIVANEDEYTLITPPPLGPIASGDTVTLEVSYSPLRASPALGVLELGLNDDEVLAVDIIGFGSYADFALVPGLWHFGPIIEDCASPIKELELSNVGLVAGRVDSISFGPTTDPNFELLSTLPPDTYLEPGESLIIPVRMLGTAAFGGQTADVQVAVTGDVQPLVRSVLRGTSESEDEANRVEHFIQNERAVADILFVVDNSGSMGPMQNSLAQNFSSFIQFFTSAVDVDFHIGVTTTDTTTNGERGALVGPYISNTGPNATPDPVSTFISQVAVGTSGSATENGLLASVLAVTPPNTDPGGPNEGFLRDEGLLSIIYISDEKDQSPGPVVPDYTDPLLAAKGYRPQRLLASAIAGDFPGGCSGNGVSAQAAPRYKEIVDITGGIFESICTADWAATMQQIGFNTFTAITQFELERRADQAAGIVVYVDGVPVNPDELNGWEYDPATNSIIFNGTSVPEPGQQITVEYVAECIAP